MRVQKHIVYFAVLLSIFFFLNANPTAQELPEPYPPMTEAIEALASDQNVNYQKIEIAGWKEDSNFYYAFEPKREEPTVGFIIYPGGLVDPASYAPIARAIAAKGFLTIIVKMPSDLAIFAFDRATAVIDDYDAIKTWVIGGHSLGGVSSCAYAQNNTEKVDGVVMWASYPSGAYSIHNKDLRVISIYGTNDGLATIEEDIEPSKAHYPPDARFEPIEGGNHTQFGWYNTSPDPLQPGDSPADITREEQQTQIVQITAGFLDQFTETAFPSCPIVAIYGDASEEVALLRYFRDNFLTKTIQGKELIKLYYEWNPLIISSILEDGELKKDLQEIIDAILPLVRKAIE
jgi:hypothetical protein